MLAITLVLFYCSKIIKGVELKMKITKKNKVIIVITLILLIIFSFGFLCYKYVDKREQREEVEKTMLTDNEFWGDIIAKKVDNSIKNISPGDKDNLDSKNISPGDKDNLDIKYNLKEGNTYDYIGGDNDYTKLFNSALSNKSTEKEFLSEVNKAVCYLTQGAYEDKIKDQFVGKVWHGMKIKDCQIKHYRILEDLSVNEYEALQKQGIDKLPNGKFAVVVGSYNKPHDENLYYVRVLVTFE